MHLLVRLLKSQMIETITIRLNLVYKKGHHPISDTKLDHLITSLQRNSDQTGVQNLTIATQINCHVDQLPLLEAQCDIVGCLGNSLNNLNGTDN